MIQWMRPQRTARAKAWWLAAATIALLADVRPA